jgi:hypothetical protein
VAAEASASRSPERKRLASAAAEHNALVERRRRLVLASEKARADSMSAFLAVERAEEAARLARREGPRVLAMAAIGEGSPEIGSLEAAELALELARRAHTSAREMVEALRQELFTTDQNIPGALAERTAAVRGILDVDDAVEGLLNEFDAARAWVECLAEAIRVIGPTRLPRRYEFWDATNRPTPTVEPVAGQWREALAALERGEADTALPAIG